MELKAMPHYFIVKIEIEKQKERKEKIGSLFLHTSHTFMQRNLQCGEIVAIGSIARNQFKEAKVGQVLLFHHFVEEQNFLLEDNGFNYYNVTTSDWNGHRCEAYGVWDGKNIIPHPEYVFLEKEQPIESEVDLKELEKEIGVAPNIPMSVSESGLLLFTNWEETRESKEHKATVLMNEIKHASKSKSLSDSVKRGLEEKQKDAENITQSLNKKKYLPYILVSYNHTLQRSFYSPLEIGIKIYALNIAAQTIIDFMDKEYIVTQTKYVSGID